MNEAPQVVFGVSADGRTVAEAEVADASAARALLVSARAAGVRLAWAHSSADLAPLGFEPRPGYRRLQGRAPAGSAGADAGPLDAGPLAAGRVSDGVGPVTGDEDSATIWALAFRGQWGHKTPQEWPLDLAAGTITLGLRRDGDILGLCRVEPDTGVIDAPGLVPAFRTPGGYRRLLGAALAAVAGQPVTVESWGEPPELTAVAESFGLVTAEYGPGWEVDLDT